VKAESKARKIHWFVDSITLRLLGIQQLEAFQTFKTFGIFLSIGHFFRSVKFAGFESFCSSLALTLTQGETSRQ
jgi:hypothetical protein